MECCDLLAAWLFVASSQIYLCFEEGGRDEFKGDVAPYRSQRQNSRTIEPPTIKEKSLYTAFTLTVKRITNSRRITNSNFCFLEVVEEPWNESGDSKWEGALEA